MQGIFGLCLPAKVVRAFIGDGNAKIVHADFDSVLPRILRILYSTQNYLTWLIRKYKYINTAYENGKVIVWKSLNKQQQIKFVSFFIATFLFLELFWRMLFEFLIAYMQIRDALLNN